MMKYVITPAVLAAACVVFHVASQRGAEPAAAEQKAATASTGERPYGIRERTAWTTSKITGSPEPPPPYTVERVFPKLQFTEPVVLTNAPGSDRLFVAEREGKIYSFTNQPDCNRKDLFLDVAREINGAKQVYGMTFHPDFETNRYCYISYVPEDSVPDGTHVSRFTVSRTDPPRADPASETVIITWRSGGHNGACLEFGPDGYLYISSGDGAGSFPPDSLYTGQDVSNLLAAVLRIDVDHPDPDKPYRIPADNPFVDLDGARGEIWAYGFRNPWKISFDPANGALWVGDVGWELWELVYRVERGANYGWSLVEGRQPVHQERRRGPTPIVPPTVEHSHTEARSITGGYVYYGKRLEELAGAYIYGDYVTGKIWGVRHDGQKVTWLEELVDTPLQIICFGVDNADRLYVVGYDGTIHRLAKSPAQQINRDFPNRLSQTGLFSSVKDHAAEPGVIPYSINAEPWADGATSERFIAMPGRSSLGLYKNTNEQIGYIQNTWRFPTDTVLAKTISLEMEAGDPASLRRLETQILHFDVETWRAYTYIWNDDQTDAALSEGDGLDRTFTIKDPLAPGGQRQQTWHFASRAECILCHTTRGGSIYGFNIPQLNRDRDYGVVVDNQLRTLSHIGLFEEPLGEELAKMPGPHDGSADLNARARSYLHVNCAHCHRRGGGGTAAFDIRREYPLEKTNLLDARPTQGTFGIHRALVVASGDSYRSVLLYRMAKLGRGRMPHFGSNVVDEQGLALLHDWIGQLPISDATAQDGEDSAAKRRTSELAALEQLRSADSEPTRATAVDRLLASTSGALILLRAVDQDAFNPAAMRQIVQTSTVHPDIQVRDLFERFLPEQQRIKRLGSVIKPEQILALAGDGGRGKRLFLEAAGVQCKNCHRVQGTGRGVGPDLDQIGKKYNRVQMLETILQPSKAIDPKFVTYLAETIEGRVHTGLLVEKTAEHVVLKDAQDKQIRIAAGDVELLAPQQKSLMPELLLRDMTAQEVADLLEFLLALK